MVSLLFKQNQEKVLKLKFGCPGIEKVLYYRQSPINKLLTYNLGKLPAREINSRYTNSVKR
jgi:hypothetical protein